MTAVLGKAWLLTWGGVVLYCALIFLLSAQPNLQTPNLVPLNDKSAHLIEYLILGWLWARALAKTWPRWTRTMVVLLTLLFTAGYGATDEWHQRYVPGRFADPTDATIDAIGGTLGGISYLYWRQLQRRKEHKAGQQQKIGTVAVLIFCSLI